MKALHLHMATGNLLCAAQPAERVETAMCARARSRCEPLVNVASANRQNRQIRTQRDATCARYLSDLAHVRGDNCAIGVNSPSPVRIRTVTQRIPRRNDL
ncbi:hypothetical protein [Lysobacter antibioticus]|uniref:hypothetical protein n=1 Tax=Lysobacter antibioticus TaxID=84531 RepID=UPI0011DF08E7|nr:hypothetical protein [Lysobacter antibioticus]